MGDTMMAAVEILFQEYLSPEGINAIACDEISRLLTCVGEYLSLGDSNAGSLKTYRQKGEGSIRERKYGDINCLQGLV